MTEIEHINNKLSAIETKLDAVLSVIHAADTRLAVHIATDEAIWKKVDGNEDEIKALVQSNGKVKTKLAVMIATIAGASAGLPSLLRLLL